MISVKRTKQAKPAPNTLRDVAAGIKSRVEVMPKVSPVQAASERLAGATAALVAYNTRAALGQPFDPQLLDDARKVLAAAFAEYASAMIAEVVSGWLTHTLKEK